MKLTFKQNLFIVAVTALVLPLYALFVAGFVAGLMLIVALGMTWALFVSPATVYNNIREHIEDRIKLK